MNNEPVVVHSIITAACAALTPVLVKYGLDSNAVAGAMGAIVSAAFAVWSVLRARSKVTPVTPPVPPAG